MLRSGQFLIHLLYSFIFNVHVNFFENPSVTVCFNIVVNMILINNTVLVSLEIFNITHKFRTLSKTKQKLYRSTYQDFQGTVILNKPPEDERKHSSAFLSTIGEQESK